MGAVRGNQPQATVRIFCRYPATAWILPLDRRQQSAALAAMLAAAEQANVPVVPPAVELHLVDDAVMSAANRRSMGCQGPTNVLSFPGGCDSPRPLNDDELICRYPDS